ncbi:MAG: T9SS type A sorting domain-containing protein, partial [Balneolales bacterium]|nr:T9SS type A sorting domain-containing protein [Balneolales bacterium]
LSGELIIRSNDPEHGEVIQPISLTVFPLLSNQELSDLPTDFEISQNYPNPFNPTTSINYALPHAGNVEIRIYSILGQEVASLVNSYREAGKYSATFDARRLASGVYFYRMLVDGKEIDLKKMMLLK